MLESLSYAEIGERLGCSPEAARALAKRKQWRRQPGNVDLSEVARPVTPRTPARSPELLAKIADLQAELARAETIAAGHRADYERERERGDRLVTELKALAELMARPWWRRLAG
jgi:hypothetical protein